MPSFNVLKMKTQLMLLVAVPLLGLLYFSISSTLEKAAVARSMERLASAHTALLRAKEGAGQERAILSSIFSDDKMTSQMFEKFVSSSSAQDAYTI